MPRRARLAHHGSVNLSIERAPAFARTGLLLRPPWKLIACAAIVALWLPLLFASPSSVTSDESLYVAEAHNIADGYGFTYPSGEPITHRAPLQPLVLAYAVAFGGDGAAYGVARLTVIVNVILVVALAWRLGGSAAGLIAGFATSASAFLNGLGTTLYVDPMQCTFLLLALLALSQAARGSPVRWCVAAGACIGAAFLVKESAIQWAPLVVAAWLAMPSLRNIAGARGALASLLAFGAVVAPWWIWVYAQTSRLFLLGEPHAGATALVVCAAIVYGAFAVAVASWPSLPARVRRVTASLAVPAVVVLIAIWGVFMLYGLTHYSTWPYPNDYASTIPRYLRTVAPAAQPYFLLIVAWAVVAWRAARGDDAARLIALAALLFAPFALFTANRGLQLRDALPVVYLSYVALGVVGAYALARARESIDTPLAEALLCACIAVAALALALQQTGAFRAGNARASGAPLGAENWDSPFVKEIALSMDASLPAGAHVLSSRLYFSSLHVETDGRFRIRQMPTVRVEIDPQRDGLLVPQSNLFRWEDQDLMPARTSDVWLSLRRFPGKGYWVGLREQELLEYIRANDIDYVVLTGEDAAFSSLQYAGYFSGNPAFTLLNHIRASASDQAFIYAVDRNALVVTEYSLAISPADAASLERESGMTLDEVAAAVGQPLRITDADRGLSVREEWAAIAGVDLAAP